MLNDKTASSRISFHFSVHSNCCSCLSSRILFHLVSCWSYSSSGMLFNLSQFLVLFHSLSCWSHSSSRTLFHFSQFLDLSLSSTPKPGVEVVSLFIGSLICSILGDNAELVDFWFF